MKYENLLVLSYFKSLFSSKDNLVPAIISITAIAVSVFSLIVVLCVMKGFDVKVKQKIIESFPHIVVNTNEDYDFGHFDKIKSFEKTFESYSGIIVNEDFSVIQIKGVDDFNSIQGVSPKLNLNKLIQSKNQIPIIIEKSFSVRQNRFVGDELELLIPDFSNKKPKIKLTKARIVGISDISDRNFTRLYTLNRNKENFVKKNESFIEIVLFNPFDSQVVSSQIVKEFKNLKYKVIDWQSSNFNLFNLMKLERISLGIFLSFLIIISATTIYSNMMSLISQKKNEIGTLILLGSTKSSLIKIFTCIGLLVGLIGIIIGVFFATAIVLLLAQTNIVDNLSIDLSFYGIDGFPIIFSAIYYVYIVLFAVFTVMLSSFLPSYMLLSKNVESLIKRDY
jgi:lipoprotein-releasing system permease protein